MNRTRAPLAHCIALAVCGVTSLAGAATVTVDSATTTGQVLSGETTLQVDGTGSITTSGKSVELKNATSGTGVIVDNRGLIKSTGDRGLDSSGSNPARTYQIINREGATIDAAKQGIRISGNLAGTRVSIDNAGTLISQTDRAIMLKDLKTNVQIDITNRATGLIRGVKEDAMRVGNNATIINHGTISSGDMSNADAKYDGIDFDASSGGKVENHGTLSGGRHGITTDVGAELINHASGVVIGRNGSGFGSDGNGRVTNYGRISGAYNGLVADGDGDGVDIDGEGWIDNHGIIEGTGAGGFKDGSANTSEGIAMGGGTIYNRAGATISGAANAILIDDSATGGAPYATYLENVGQILGLGGDAVRIIGGQNDTVINSGLISSTGGVALDLGGGADSLTLRSGSQFVGRVDGGAGRDVLSLDDTAGGSFGNSVNIEWLAVKAGRWTLDSHDFSEGGRVLAGAELVNLGRIGGTLDIHAGGTYAGGGHVHHLNLAAGSTLAFAVSADGSHSPLLADGHVALDGARLEVRASAGSYPNTRHYQVIQADAGVSGRFASVTSNFAFLTPTLRYAADSVELDLHRNDVAFADVAGNGNGAKVAGSISAQGSPQLYNALVTRSTGEAREALNQLAAPNNASLAGSTLGSTSQVSGVMLGAMQSFSSGLGGNLQSSRLLEDGPLLAATGVPTGARNLNDPSARGRLWVQALGSRGRLDGSQSGHDLDSESRGAIAGVDWAVAGDWRLGVLGGYSRTDLEAGSGFNGDTDSMHLGVYSLRQSGPLALRLGAAYSLHDGQSKREVAFAGFSDRLRGRYDAESFQAFSELGYAMGSGKVQAEPFAALGYQYYARDSYDEKGGAAALQVDDQDQGNLTSTFGVRLAHLNRLANGTPFTPYLSAAWRHTYGNVDSTTRQSFLSGGSAFSVEGSALDRNSLLLDTGVNIDLSSTQSLSMGYSGELGSNAQNHAIVAQWQMGF
ncbi:autotransporter outer membrane beta-barrel domain-containing protein [Pseudomonas sp. HMWF032]|uniref:autotransporter family protein n=1 Tax=Pseudomonas sp. HMWF032 TaxID=2056866 RepID=UPI000D38394E|nr:autotransporter outer membrane beta-barrel domain-containing protein [Pseudomonas sp. HMWF032]PTS84814.1 autotransporter outer membrane beta-barrel domain-containing protein [Pseudomonas sp. HMWF032]PTT84414.1 autotransporter outer membrane beta-barrel domain-containing protein [Pseudomonas sp. HMWF010]